MMTESDARGQATAAIRTSLAPFGVKVVQQALDRLAATELPTDTLAYIETVCTIARETAEAHVRVARRRVTLAETLAKVCAQPIVGRAN